MANPQVRAIVRAVERLTERIITKITLDITANLIEATPVDTGWARANWVPAIGRPFEADLEGITPTPQDAASAGAQQQVALVSLATGYKLNRGKVFISNNVPYILGLNEGTSRQAPSGFVQRAIKKAVTQDIGGLAT